jgi:hypothetical protein
MLEALRQPIGRPQFIPGAETFALRLPGDVILAIEQMAAITGWSKSLIVRKMLDGAMRRIQKEIDEHGDVRLALNRWSKCK